MSSETAIFNNRKEAGQALAALLDMYAHRDDTLVLALPRGGMPVAYEVAREIDAPLDVFLVRKLGVPGQEELAMGAISTGGMRSLEPRGGPRPGNPRRSCRRGNSPGRG